MEKLNSFEESLKMTRFALKLTGVNLDKGRSKNFIEYMKNTWLFYFNSIFMHLAVLGEIYWFIEGIQMKKNFGELTIVAPCILIGFLSNSKTIAILASMDDVKGVLKILEELHPEEIEGEERSDESERNKIIGEATRLFDLVVKTLLYLNLFLVSSFCVIPLFIVSYKYFKTGELMLLMNIIKYPFDPLDIKFWFIAYLHQCWSCIIVNASIVGSDTLFCAICIDIQMQFRLLRKRFENVVTSNQENKETNWELEDKILEDNLQDKVDKLIIQHKELIVLVELVEKIYSKAIFFNFVVSSFLICLTGFNITAIRDTTLVVAFITFLLTSLSQIFMTCYFGDMIMRTSIEVSDGVYNSHWYLMSNRIKKSMFIVQMRAQKPCRLTAMQYTDVNLRAFTKILSTSWSYFTLLNTVYSGKR